MTPPLIYDSEFESKYYPSLDSIKDDGYTPVKATSVLTFFKIGSSCRVISKDNIVPFTDIPYVVHSTAADKFFLYTYRNYDIDTMFFYYQREGSDRTEVESLFKYISDGNLYVLFTAEQLSEIKDMMERCYRHKFNGEPPRERWGSIFYDIMRETLRYEEYVAMGKNLTGYRTVCKQFETMINDLWNSVYLKTKSKG